MIEEVAGVSAPSKEEKAHSRLLAYGDETLQVGTHRQVIFRAANEAKHRRVVGIVADEQLEVLCECEHADCLAHHRIDADEYEAVRRFPTRFLTKPEHVAADERIVDG